jgi:GNAT superfamily N-acetyltransferase
MVIVIRDYEHRDAAAITELFYETVRSVNLDHYSEEQVRAWAPALPDPEIWHSRMSERCTLVAEEEGLIIGFAELERDGYLDMLYCRKDRIRHGVGLALYQAVEQRALKAGLDRIFTDASITAMLFFEHRGFSVLGKQAVIRRGIVLANFRMEKRLLRSI